MKDLSNEMIRTGVDYIFGIPGSGNSFVLLDHLQKHGANFQLTHSEASGVIIAAIYGLISRSPGVALSIKGPGVANMVPGLAVCSFEDIPVIAVSEAASLESYRSTVHKRIDHSRLTGEVTKARRAYGLVSTGSFSDAWEIARAETPGPVLLEMIDDINGNGLEEEVVATPGIKNRHLAGVGELKQKIRNSQRPVVIAGSVAIRAGLEIQCSRLTVPVFTTLAAKGLIDEHRECAAGVYTGAGKDSAPEVTIIAQSDLVIGIGLRAKELLRFQCFDCPAINLDYPDAQYLHGPEFSSMGDIRHSNELLDELRKKEWGHDLVATTIAKLRETLYSTDFLPAPVFDLLKQALGEKCRLVVDTGLFCTVAEHIWQASREDSFWCSANGRYMGTAVPMAIGATMADPECSTVAVVGDGGIGMYFSDLRIAVEKRLPILVLFFTDGGYGSIQAVAESKGLDLNLASIKASSWASSLKSLGMDGTVAHSLEEISEYLTIWDQGSGPLFVECRFDQDKYRHMVDTIR